MFCYVLLFLFILFIFIIIIINHDLFNSKLTFKVDIFIIDVVLVSSSVLFIYLSQDKVPEPAQVLTQ